MALHSARFCAGVRPGPHLYGHDGHVMLLKDAQDFLDPLADAAPLAGADRDRRAAAEPASPDRRQSEPLGGVEVDAAGRRREVDDQRAISAVLTSTSSPTTRVGTVENMKSRLRRQRRQFVERVRRRAGHISGRALLGIARRDMGMRAERHQIARQHRADRALADDAGVGVVDGDGGVLDDDLEQAFDDGRGPLQHQAAVPFVFVQLDRQRVAVRLEVLVGPAEDDVRARRHAGEHGAIRNDRRRCGRRKQRAARRNAGDRKQREACAFEHRSRIVEMLHARNALLRPGKTMSAHIARRCAAARRAISCSRLSPPSIPIVSLSSRSQLQRHEVVRSDSFNKPFRSESRNAHPLRGAACSAEVDAQ